MGSDLDYMQYVAEQIDGAGSIFYRKMFGEYGVYCDGKMVALVCDNQFMLKNIPEARSIVESRGAVTEAIPYVGAKPWILIEDLDDTEFLAHLIKATACALSLPKPKIKKR